MASKRSSIEDGFTSRYLLMEKRFPISQPRFWTDLPGLAGLISGQLGATRPKNPARHTNVGGSRTSWDARGRWTRFWAAKRYFQPKAPMGARERKVIILQGVSHVNRVR
jgi:hypothetical protein